MRQLMLLLATLLVPLVLLSQTTTQPDEISNLKEKVSSLAKKNNNLQWQLGKFKKSELLLNDSLKKQITQIDQNVTTMNDSISAIKIVLNATDVKVTDLQKSVNTFTTIVYIALLILLIVVIAVYFIVISKIKAIWTKSDNLIMNTKDSFMAEISRTKKDLEGKIESHTHQ